MTHPFKTVPVPRIGQSVVKVLTAVILFSLLMTGCRTSKELVTKPSKKDMELLESLVVEKPAFTTLNSKVEFKLSTRRGISTSMKGSVKLSTDSCILLSLQPFIGIEIAKCLIRPDSFIVVSRIHQIYASESIANMPYSSLGLFNLFQKVLTNRLFLPGNAKPTSRDLARFTWQKDKNETKLNLTQNDYSLDYTLNDDQQYCKLRAYPGKDSDYIQVDYSRFEKKNDFLFPQFVEMNAVGKDKRYNLQITYLKPSFDVSADFGFPISAKYKKVTLKELINRFQNML
jgi:hypothetical protein